MAEFINGTYNDSEELRVQGSFRDIRPYFKQGYSKVREDNRNWILSKPASLEMTFRENGKFYTFDMKARAKKYFNKKRISDKVANDFIDGVKNGTIIVTINENGVYEIH